MHTLVSCDFLGRVCSFRERACKHDRFAIARQDSLPWRKEVAERGTSVALATVGEGAPANRSNRE